jgi:hypothetical protein
MRVPQREGAHMGRRRTDVARTNALVLSTAEAEALAFAREQIAGWSAGSIPWSPASPFTEEASPAFVRDFLRMGARSGSAMMRMEVIKLARHGDPDAKAVLCETIIEMKTRREELPTDLENYNMELLHGGMGHQPPGPKRKNKLLRDIFIALTVAAVRDRFPSLDPTGRSARRRSICWIVAEALAAEGRGMGVKAVETIWATYGPAMPTEPGWTSTFIS